VEDDRRLWSTVWQSSEHVQGFGEDCVLISGFQ
jgi:hypothetical protein